MKDDWIQTALDPKNEGKFSDKAKRAKMTTLAFAKKVIKKYKGVKGNTPIQTRLLRQAVMAKTLIEKNKKK
tara:strand:+ start:5081 stop:5293 length:213 start_codon:yes stop_codon:yes gene_type:complete